MQILRGNSRTDKLAANRRGMEVLRGNSGTNKMKAEGGGMQVLRGNRGTDNMTAAVTACNYCAEILELTNWQQ